MSANAAKNELAASVEAQAQQCLTSILSEGMFAIGILNIKDIIEHGSLAAGHCAHVPFDICIQTRPDLRHFRRFHRDAGAVALILDVPLLVQQAASIAVRSGVAA